LESITPLLTTERLNKETNSEATIWYPDGDMAAEIYSNLGTIPDVIEAIDLAKLFASAPTMLKLLMKVNENQTTAEEIREFLIKLGYC